MSSSEAIYSIGAVSRMLGIPSATLRAWEDRYDVVVPERSAGGQRLYTRSQVEQLTFIQGSMGSGSSAADAHRVLRERVAAGQGLVAPAPERQRVGAARRARPVCGGAHGVLVAHRGVRGDPGAGRRGVAAPVRGSTAGDRRARSHDLGGAWRGAVPGTRGPGCPRHRGVVRWRSVHGRSTRARTSSCRSRSRHCSSCPRCAICWVRARCGGRHRCSRFDDRSACRVAPLGSTRSWAAACPPNAINLVIGPPGSGKTILAEQYLFHNATEQRPGVFLSTVSEPFDKVLRYGESLDFFDPDALGTRVFYDDLGSALGPRRNERPGGPDRRAPQGVPAGHPRHRQLQGHQCLRGRRSRVPAVPA